MDEKYFFFLIDTNKGKIENKTKPGIFLGYSSYSPGYQVLDITSKSIVIICDEYFNESTLDSLDTSYFRSLNPLDKRSEGETIVVTSIRSIHLSKWIWNEWKQTEYINSVDNIDLMNEYNNENMLDTNSEKEKKLIKIKIIED